MAVNDDTGFFVLKFECFSNKIFNKKALRQVSLNSSIGSEVSKIFEDDKVSVVSVFTGERENEVNCSAELETPFSVINDFKHKYVLVTLKETREKDDVNNNCSESILKVMMECRRSYDSHPPER